MASEPLGSSCTCSADMSWEKLDSSPEGGCQVDENEDRHAEGHRNAINTGKVQQAGTATTVSLLLDGVRSFALVGDSADGEPLKKKLSPMS